MANGAELTLSPLRLVARSSLRSFDHVGRFSILLADMFRGLAEWRIWIPRTLEQATAVGYGSLFIVLLVAGFAGAVTLIPCYIGFNTQQGAEGVGRSTTTAVVSASVAILVLDALTTKLLLGVK